jgi:hypothetical protein
MRTCVKDFQIFFYFCFYNKIPYLTSFLFFKGDVCEFGAELSSASLLDFDGFEEAFREWENTPKLPPLLLDVFTDTEGSFCMTSVMGEVGGVGCLIPSE